MSLIKVRSFAPVAFREANRDLGIHQHFCEKGRPWQNLIESQFGIQARLGEYRWQNRGTVDEAIEVHRELVHDHNRLLLFASIADVRAERIRRSRYWENIRGALINKTGLHEAFSRKA